MHAYYSAKHHEHMRRYPRVQMSTPSGTEWIRHHVFMVEINDLEVLATAVFSEPTDYDWPDAVYLGETEHIKISDLNVVSDWSSAWWSMSPSEEEAINPFMDGIYTVVETIGLMVGFVIGFWLITTILSW